MSDDVTTIQLRRDVVKSLKGIKKYRKQTYDEIITELIKIAKSAGMKNQYDEFLHKIQQAKMRELWDNKEDEAWENA